MGCWKAKERGGLGTRLINQIIAGIVERGLRRCAVDASVREMSVDVLPRLKLLMGGQGSGDWGCSVGKEMTFCWRVRRA